MDYTEEDRGFTSNCWIWQRSLNEFGYGRLNRGKGRTKKAHRHYYEDAVGPIPAGLVIHHLCEVRCCVNPEHLRPVTQKENIRLCKTSAANMQRAKTHCPQGHPYDAENTYHSPTITNRLCRTCSRATSAERSRRYRVKKKLGT